MAVIVDMERPGPATAILSDAANRFFDELPRILDIGCAIVEGQLGCQIKDERVDRIIAIFPPLTLMVINPALLAYEWRPVFFSNHPNLIDELE